MKFICLLLAIGFALCAVNFDLPPQHQFRRLKPIRANRAALIHALEQGSWKVGGGVAVSRQAVCGLWRSELRRENNDENNLFTCIKEKATSEWILELVEEAIRLPSGDCSILFAEALPALLSSSNRPLVRDQIKRNNMIFLLLEQHYMAFGEEKEGAAFLERVPVDLLRECMEGPMDEAFVKFLTKCSSHLSPDVASIVAMPRSEIFIEDSTIWLPLSKIDAVFPDLTVRKWPFSDPIIFPHFCFPLFRFKELFGESRPADFFKNMEPRAFELLLNLFEYTAKLEIVELISNDEKDFWDGENEDIDVRKLTIRFKENLLTKFCKSLSLIELNDLMESEIKYEHTGAYLVHLLPHLPATTLEDLIVLNPGALFRYRILAKGEPKADGMLELSFISSSPKFTQRYAPFIINELAGNELSSSEQGALTCDRKYKHLATRADLNYTQMRQLVWF